MGTKNTKIVDFLGQKISISADENGRLAVKALELANLRVNEMAKRNSSLSPHALSVLVLLELAGEMVKDRQTIDDYRKELDTRCKSILQEIDSLAAS